MIQVCSRCGTRWNVRDRQRVWCPRCNGTLLAPSARPVTGPSEWSARRPHRRCTPTAAAEGPARLPPGYRWIAVRPGAAPPARRRQRNLGPTPRYAVIPRWGLVERFDTAEFEQQAEPRRGPSIAALRTTLVATIAALGLAALVHMVRYALLIINRDVLLNPVVAWLATWFGDPGQCRRPVPAVRQLRAADELADRPAVGGIQTRWAPRTSTAVGVTCRMPGAAGELGMGAGLRSRTGQRRGRSTAFADRSRCGGRYGCCPPRCRCSPSRPASPRDAQGIADNTVTTIVAYLIAMATMVLVGRVLIGFERRPVEKPAKRWVIVADEVCARNDRANPAFRLSPKARTRQHSRMNSGDAGAGQGFGGHPFVVAHRGASADRPEHTLAAYELALQEGADGVECDVRLTRDGHLVCVHDRRVDRTSNGTGLVSEMSLAQLKRIGLRLVAFQLAGRRLAGRHRAADPRRPGVAGAGLAPAGEDLHRDQASGALRRAGGKQGAGAAAPVRHRIARRRRICPVRW